MLARLDVGTHGQYQTAQAAFDVVEGSSAAAPLFERMLNLCLQGYSFGMVLPQTSQ
jgi:hypothetical protein